MAEEEGFNTETERLQAEFAKLSDEMQIAVASGGELFDDITLLNAIYYLWVHWIDFHIVIIDPEQQSNNPAKIIEPGEDAKTKQPENVYRILDFGNRLSASAGEECIPGTRSTGKMLNTVRKMLDIVVDKVATSLGTPTIDPAVEIRLAFDGHEIAQRMAFKATVMRQENLMITNFEPGDWGELQLRTMEVLADKGFLAGL